MIQDERTRVQVYKGAGYIIRHKGAGCRIIRVQDTGYGIKVQGAGL